MCTRGSNPALLRGRSASPLAAMRTITASGIAVGTLIAGGVLGFGVSHMLCDAKLTSYELASVDNMSTFVMIQRFKGTPQAYEAALRAYLVVLDARERAGPGLFSQYIEVDRAMVYARLAILAADRSDLSAAAQYRSRAEALCPHIGWKVCSAEEIVRMVRRLDEHSLWNPSRAPPDHGS